MRLSVPSPNKMVLADVTGFFFKLTGAGLELIVLRGGLASKFFVFVGGSSVVLVDDFSGARGRVFEFDVAGFIDSCKVFAPIDIALEFGDRFLLSVGGGLLRGDGTAFVLI